MCDCLSCRNSSERQSRLHDLENALKDVSLAAFTADDLTWLVPLMQGYPENERVYDLDALEKRFEKNLKRKGKR